MDLLHTRSNVITLRSSAKIKFSVDISNTDIYGKGFYMRGVKYWNQLPTEIQNVPTKIEFKQMLTYDIISTLDG